MGKSKEKESQRRDAEYPNYYYEKYSEVVKDGQVVHTLVEDGKPTPSKDFVWGVYRRPDADTTEFLADCPSEEMAKIFIDALNCTSNRFHAQQDPNRPEKDPTGIETLEDLRNQAERLTNITGWICKKCRVYHGDGPESKRISEYCCTGLHECKNCEEMKEGCVGVGAPHKTLCPPCMSEHYERQWSELEEVEWKGEPLQDWHGDIYFFSPEEVSDWISDNDLDPNHQQLVIADPKNPPEFDILDNFEHYLPEGKEVDATEINKKINEWIRSQDPWCYYGSKRKISITSLKEGIDWYEEVPEECRG